MSEVDVQPSTVMRLNVASTASRSTRSHCPASSGASVVTTAIIVPRSGRIIPAPLAIPPTRISPSAVATERSAVFAAASVVRIASAAAAAASTPSPSSASAAAMPASTRSIGSGTPITPVDAMRTALAGQPRPSATSAAIRSASRIPCSPVAALALPLWTRTARMAPFALCARDSSTGGAAVALRVKTAAAGTVASAATSATSGRPELLIPAVTPAAAKPRGCRMPTATGPARRAPRTRRARA